MKFLFASDSFKGTLTSEQTVELLAKAAREVFGDIEYSGVPVADGGEGTVAAVVAAEHGVWMEAEVYGPLMEKRKASYGKLDEKRAVLEMATASGLPLVPVHLRNPLLTTTYGTGELIRHALDQGFTDLSIAIGGSATNDGGMGCARALGVRFLDGNGNALEGRGEDLEKVSRIDISGLDPRIRNTKITVMCDVTNPLCGENGATYTFGAQKGATPEMQARMEAGMVNYRDVIRRQFDVDPDQIRGAGAAGGLGIALTVFLGGEMKSGIETVLDLIGFDERLEGTDLVVTGEGQTDWQSCFGKVMQGVGKRAKAKGVTAVGLSGSLGRDAAQIFNHGIASLMTTVDAPMPLEEALERAEELYYLGAVRMFRFLKAGMMLKERSASSSL
ncbi:MAG: glycerate kinase [Anaerolineaceae bacterium]|nr:glycerate kinase [Oscillospiraceae bacterium]MBQ6481548.1 glycerate kinase [Anaerolineaceae bacterium]